MPTHSAQYQQGFTLVELIVTLAIAAILLNIAAPSFASAMLNARIASNTNLLTQSIHFGRSEAVKGLQPVSICARATNTSCETTNDWSKGWIVYSDSSAVGNAGTLDAADEILKIVTLDTDSVSITAEAIVGNSANAAVSNMRINSRGFANWTAGTFSVCNTTDSDLVRSLIVLGAGAVRSTSASAGKAAKDAFDQDIVC